MEKEYDVVELVNGVRVAVVDAINYHNRIFLLVGKLDKEDNISEELQVFEKIDDEISEVNDNDLVEKLIQTFENRIND